MVHQQPSQLDAYDLEKSRNGSEHNTQQIQRQQNNSTMMKRSFTENADLFSERRDVKEESVGKNNPEAPSSLNSDRNKDEAIRQLQSQNQELSKIIDSMAQDMKQVREQQQQQNFIRTQQLPPAQTQLAVEETPPHSTPSNIDKHQIEKLQQQATALFDLRREHYTLMTDKRKLEIENQMLKATADNGEQRMRERQHYEDLINDKENQILDLKERLMKRDFEITTLQQKCHSLETQIANLKRERERLLDVSQNLKASISKLEKKQILESVTKFPEVANDIGNSAPRQTQNTENSKLLNTSQQINRLNGTIQDGGMPTMLTLDNQMKAAVESSQIPTRNAPASAVATQENETDKQMSALFDEVNQMKVFMEQIRKGDVIGEFAQNSAKKKTIDHSDILKDSIKAQNLEDLKRQRQVLEVSPQRADSALVVSEPMISPMTMPNDYKVHAADSNQISMRNMSPFQRQHLKQIQQSIEEVQKLKQSAESSVLIDLQEKENQLTKLLLSGLGDYQPQMNMFGSNVFSSVETSNINQDHFQKLPSNEVSISYQKSIDQNLNSNLMNIKTNNYGAKMANPRPVILN